MASSVWASKSDDQFPRQQLNPRVIGSVRRFHQIVWVENRREKIVATVAVSLLKLEKQTGGVEDKKAKYSLYHFREDMLPEI